MRLNIKGPYRPRSPIHPVMRDKFVVAITFCALMVGILWRVLR